MKIKNEDICVANDAKSIELPAELASIYADIEDSISNICFEISSIKFCLKLQAICICATCVILLILELLCFYRGVGALVDIQNFGKNQIIEVAN